VAPTSSFLRISRRRFGRLSLGVGSWRLGVDVPPPLHQQIDPAIGNRSEPEALVEPGREVLSPNLANARVRAEKCPIVRTNRTQRGGGIPARRSGCVVSRPGSDRGRAGHDSLRDTHSSRNSPILHSDALIIPGNSVLAPAYAPVCIRAQPEAAASAPGRTVVRTSAHPKPHHPVRVSNRHPVPSPDSGRRPEPGGAQL
jgi:hypothetical protein